MNEPVLLEHAAAKLNVFLRVMGRREDGYHDIETVILPLDLHDVVRIQVAGSTRVDVAGPRAGELSAAGGEHLARRAIEAFVSATGIAATVEVTIEKRIPVTAGMGGGSADAAAVLRVLSRLHRIDPLDLLPAAAGLGADVPALLHGGPVLVEGRGDRLTPVMAASANWVIAPQAFGVRTADAYRWWDEDPVSGPDPGALIAALETGNVDLLGSAFYDDLESVVLARHPAIAVTRDALLEAGAAGAVMTGSGPTVVALARHPGEAARIAAAVPGAFVTTGPPRTMGTPSGVV